jgi:Leucine-rich repeat (LRR) protein
MKILLVKLVFILLLSVFSHLLSNSFESISLIIKNFDKNLLDSINNRNVDHLVIDLHQNVNLPGWLRYCKKIKTLYLINSNKNNKNYDISIISELFSLDVLSIYGLNGVVIKNIGSNFFSILRVLRIDSCNLRQIPTWLTKLRSLESLDINDNSINSVPKSIAKIPKLLDLGLYGTMIETVPSEIFEKETLWNLSLEYNYKLNLKKLFKNINNKRLKALFIGASRISNIPKEVQNLSKVGFLCLWRNNIKELPKEMTLLNDLVSLDLSYNSFSKFPNIITKIEKLKNFEIDSNQIESIPIDLIKGMKNIKSISLKGNPISIEERERILKELPNIDFKFE